MANPVAVSDLEARWRPLTQEETVTAQTALDDAWAYLSANVPNIDAQMAGGTTPTALVKAVVAAVVLRALQNPDGAVARSVSIDDFTQTTTLAGRDTAALGRIYLTDEELRMLGVSNRRRAKSVTMGSYTRPLLTLDGVDLEDATWVN